MTRVQKKCLVVSLCCHGVIMGAIVVSAAFRSEPPITPDQILVLIPSNMKLVDRPVVSSGQGASAPRPTPPVSRRDPAPVAPAPPRPARPESHPTDQTNPTHRPTPRTTPEETKVATTKSATETAPKKPHEITPTFDAASNSSKTSSRSSSPSPASRSNAQAQSNQRLSKEIEELFSSLNNSIASKQGDSKTPSLPAVDGGEAFVNYRTAIVSAYYNAWITPDDTTHRTSSAVVKIVVARDGSIVSAEITQPSGDARIDRSVQRALDAVKSLPAFPSGASDAQRTFNIRFNLDAKESAG